MAHAQQERRQRPHPHAPSGQWRGSAGNITLGVCQHDSPTRKRASEESSRHAPRDGHHAERDGYFQSFLAYRFAFVQA